jgi:hypothetical protein
MLKTRNTDPRRINDTRKLGNPDPIVIHNITIRASAPGSWMQGTQQFRGDLLIRFHSDGRAQQFLQGEFTAGKFDSGFI